MNKEKKKILVTMRHGERTDFIGLKPHFGKYDPELTKNGEEQAFMSGKILYEQLKKIGVDLSKVKVTIFSSPFMRTMQTGRELIKGYNSINTTNSSPLQINIDYLLSEYINYEFDGHFPKSFLNSLQQGAAFKDQFKDFKLNNSNLPDLLPKEEEYDSTLNKRMAKCLKTRLKQINDSYIDVAFMISHGSPLSELNQDLGYKGNYGYQHVNYCQMYYYYLDNSNNTEFISTIYP